MTAVDSVFGGAIWARHRYDYTAVRFGWRPADVFTNLHADESLAVRSGSGSGGSGGDEQHVRVIDMALFDEMEREDGVDKAVEDEAQHNDDDEHVSLTASSTYQRRDTSRDATSDDNVCI